MNEYYSIMNREKSTIEIEKSKFIAYTCPVQTEQEAIDFINEIKKKHYDATHNVSAFHIRKNHFYKKYSDDGEPSGTAGLPSLQVILNKQLIDVCVVISRYFGGIKLGAGGLARAYSEATSKALEQSMIIRYELMSRYQILLSYDLLNSVQYYLNKNEILVSNITYEDQVQLEILLSEKNTRHLENLIELTASKISISMEESLFVAIDNNKIVSEKKNIL